jgi:hypothetical protein
VASHVWYTTRRMASNKSSEVTNWKYARPRKSNHFRYTDHFRYHLRLLSRRGKRGLEESDCCRVWTDIRYIR